MKYLYLFIALLLLNACSFENHKSAKIGEVAAEISAKNLLGNKINLNDDKNNLKVLVFFQNGCSSCLKELPYLDDFIQNYPNKISVYAINSANDMQTIQSLAKKFDFKNVKILKDDLKITQDRYAIFATPTTIIIKNGIIKDRILGETPWENLKSKLISLL
ncbi:TlpA disulfide reductase family protein [Campylobacter molothri]|uniref:TlpA family protein disulfide reductase n=1 Tax=Campylobacter molothri TaxID=1032242 RepID=UPI00301DE91B|nr:TlpA family protein disulfide reductase [Campylobacter sp. RM17709]